MKFVLKHFDTPLIRFSAESGAEPSIVVQWTNDRDKALLPLDLQQEITAEKLEMVDKAEQLLMDLGFRQMRVRVHADMARIEVLPEDLPRLMEEETRLRIYNAFREYGFSYVSADLKGYRTGSMNEALTKNGD